MKILWREILCKQTVLLSFCALWHMTAWWVSNDCLMTAWWLPDDCLMTAYWLPDDYLMNAWWLPDCIMTASWLSANLVWTLNDNKTRQQRQMVFVEAALPVFNVAANKRNRWLPDNWLWQNGDCLMTAWWFPDDCLMIACKPLFWRQTHTSLNTQTHLIPRIDLITL